MERIEEAEAKLKSEIERIETIPCQKFEIGKKELISIYEMTLMLLDEIKDRDNKIYLLESCKPSCKTKIIYRHR